MGSDGRQWADLARDGTGKACRLYREVSSTVSNKSHAVVVQDLQVIEGTDGAAGRREHCAGAPTSRVLLMFLTGLAERNRKPLESTERRHCATTCSPSTSGRTDARRSCRRFQEPGKKVPDGL
jgi:hypothetical protein